MPHLAGRCDCGREMHFPKSAMIGYQWTCRKCGKVWTLSNQGKPLDRMRSKAPPKRPTTSSSSPQKPNFSSEPYSPPQNSSNSVGCSIIVGILVVLSVFLLIFVLVL